MRRSSSSDSGRKVELSKGFVRKWPLCKLNPYDITSYVYIIVTVTRCFDLHVVDL